MQLRPFIRSHIKGVMQQWKNGPFDSYLREYYKSNKTLGPSERSIISQVVFDLLRHDVLLSHFSNSLDRKIELLPHIEEYQQNERLPFHIRASCPKELFDIVADDYSPETAMRYLQIMNEKAPLTIRANPIKCSREELMQHFEYFRKTEHSPYGLVMSHQNVNLKDTQQYRDGLFEIQDEASQLCALRVKCQPKDKVLDYCCGSGGKTLAFAHQMQNQGLIEVYDVRQETLLKAKQRFKRAGIQNYQDFSKRYKFDWIMLDVPCSGIGTLRRNPDIKYKINRDRINELIQLQRKIFDDVIRFKKENGKIVYTTCSFLKEENEMQAQYFCKQYNLTIQDGKCFQSLPEKGQMDAFYSITLI